MTQKLVIRGALPRLGFTALCAVGALVLAACGSNSPNPSSTAVGKLTGQQLVGAANKEGTINWYTTQDPSVLKPFTAAFNKSYPKIKVNYVSLGGNDVLTRIITEQRGRKYVADLATGTGASAEQFISAGIVQSYNIPTEQTLPLPLGKIPTGYRGVISLSTDVIAYNPAVLAAHHMSPPTSFEDLTKPEWKGKFALVIGGAEDAYPELIGAMGHAAAAKLMTALGNNSPLLSESGSAGVSEVQAGNPMVAAFVAGDDSAIAHKETPSRYDFVNPVPLPTVVTVVDLVKNAPHPAAAELFLNWLESQAGQEAVVQDLGKIVLRNDVTQNSEIWSPAKSAPAFEPPGTTPTQENAWIAEVDRLVKAPGH